MKLIYIYTTARYNTDNHEELGVRKKIDAQMSRLEDIGCICDIYEIKIVFMGVRIFIKSLYLAYKQLSSCYDYKDNDILYIRTLNPYVINSYLLWKHHNRKNMKIIFEIQSIEKNEFRLQKRNNLFALFKYVYLIVADLTFGKYNKSHANGIVCVTNEITDYNKKIIKDANVKILTLGNGVDTSLYHICHPISHAHNELHVLCVALVQYWHGIDRFIRGMYEYSGDKTINLHIVGDGPELSNLKSLTSELHLESHVIFHGFKSGTDLDVMFDQCQIAVGSLGGFRINMHEMSSLKSGEYCARGIPFILAATAMDFPEDWPYIFHVPETETPINMDDVIGFADRVLANPNHVQEMREYAESHLDWMIKMKVLKEFLENL